MATSASSISADSERYDYCFVLVGFPPGNPSGGRKIVFELASGLVRRGRKVAIAYMSRAGAFIYDYTRNPVIFPNDGRDHLAWLLIRPLTTRLGSLLTKRVFNKFLRVEFDYGKLAGVDEYFPARPGNLRIEPARMVATYWPTAYFVKAFITQHQAAGFYLVQNKEDDPAVSGQLADLAAETYRFELRKVVISTREVERFRNESPALIPIGFDNQKFRLTVPTAERRQPSLLVPLRAGKGWEYGLEAVQAVHSTLPGLRLMSFGNIARNKIPAFVEYHYIPSDSELLSLYNQSSIFVLPSLYEGSSATILEAMATGNAIIATDSGNDYLKNGLNAVIVPPRDSPALVAAIVELVRDDTKRASLQAASLEFSTTRQGYEEMVDRFLEATS